MLCCCNTDSYCCIITTMAIERFYINSEDAEILSLLETCENLREIATRFGRDVSVVSRRLQKISEDFHFIEKIEGRWRLNKSGLRFNQWTRNAINEQKKYLVGAEEVTIGMSREFASRIFIPEMKDFYKEFSQIKLLTSDEGIEGLILDRLIDVGFDCGIPYSPDVAFKKVCPENLLICAGPKFIEREEIKSARDLPGKPYVHYGRNSLSTIQEITRHQVEIKLSVSDIGSLREALLSGHGWSLIPRYCVLEELRTKKLVEIRGFDLKPLSYGVWWNKNRPKNDPLVDFSLEWLKSQKYKLI